MFNKIIISAVFTLAFVSASQSNAQYLTRGNSHNHDKDLKVKDCPDCRYVTKSDKKQTLGRLDPHSVFINKESDIAVPEVPSNSIQKLIVDKPVEKAAAIERVEEKKKAIEPTKKIEPAQEAKVEPSTKAVNTESDVGEIKPIEKTTQETTQPKATSVEKVAPAAVVLSHEDQNEAPVQSDAIPEVVQKEVEKVKEIEVAPLPVISKGVDITSLSYDAGDINISSNNVSILEGVIAKMNADPKSQIKINSYGHSDSIDSREARRASLQRAIKVRRFLIDNDIDASRIIVKSIEDSKDMQNRVDLQISAE